MAAPSTLRKPSANAVPVLVPAGTHSGKPSLPLGRPFTLIGSRHRAHLHLLSRTVSKSHAAIVSTDSGLYIRDLASRERVFVNNQQAREVVLADGDLLRIGSFNFKYKDPAAKRRPLIGRRAPAAVLHVDGSNIPLSIESRSMVIGRRATCDIPLIELSASTIHAIIFESNGQRYIRDLGSRTGTFVNGATVHQRVLNDNDQIKVGDTEMRYAVTAKAEQPPVEAADAVGAGEDIDAIDLAPTIESEPVGEIDLAPDVIEPVAAPTRPALSRAKPAARAPKAPALPAKGFEDQTPIPLAGDEDLLPLASDDDLIPLASEPPPAPREAPRSYAAAPVPLDLAAAAEANHAAHSEPAAVPIAPPIDAARLDDHDGDDDRHILVATDLHQEKLSGSGSFADVEANLEEGEGEEASGDLNLDWWLNDTSTAASGNEAGAKPAEAPADESARTDSPIPLHRHEAIPIETTPALEHDQGLTVNLGAVSETVAAQPWDLGIDLTAPPEPMPNGAAPESIEHVPAISDTIGADLGTLPLEMEAGDAEDDDFELGTIPVESPAPHEPIADEPAATPLPPTNHVELEPIPWAQAPIEPVAPLQSAFEELTPPLPEPQAFTARDAADDSWAAPIAAEPSIQPESLAPESVFTNSLPAVEAPAPLDIAEPQIAVPSSPEDVEPLAKTPAAPPSTPPWDTDNVALSDEPSLEEFLPSAEPTPESAQALEPQLSTDEAFPLDTEDLGALEPQPIADLSDTRFEASVTELSDDTGEPLVEEPAAEESEMEDAAVTLDQPPMTQAAAPLDRETVEAPAPSAPPIHHEAAPLSDDAAADMLALDAPPEEIPNLSALLGEEEQTGDAMVDSASAFLAHEEHAPYVPPPVADPIPVEELAEAAAPVEIAALDPASTGVVALEPWLAESGPAESFPVTETSASPSVPTEPQQAAEEQLAEATELEPEPAAAEVSVVTAPMDVASPLEEASAAEVDIEDFAPLEPAMDEISPVTPPLAYLEPLDAEVDGPTFTAPRDVLAEDLEPVIALPMVESTITVEVSPPPAPAQTASADESPAAEPALDVAPLNELQPLVETHLHSEFTSTQVAPIGDLEELEPASKDIISEFPEELDRELAEVAGEEPPPAPPEPVSESAPPAAKEEDLPPLPTPTLQDLLSGMSRDAGSFLGGLPMGFGSVTAPGVMPAIVKVKQDVPPPPPTLRPAPIGQVEAQLPLSKVIGVPPVENDEPPELFNDPAVLDTISDELAPIGDLTEILGEKPILPPDILQQPRTKAPSAAPAPVRPAPPPPARTTRAVTAFDGLDEIDLDELQPLSADVDEEDELQGMPSAFDGLAMGPTTPVDAFSLLPLSQDQDPFLGAKSGEGLPPAGDTAAPDAFSPRPARAGRQPGSQIVPPPASRPEPELPKKKKKWKFFGSILLLAGIGGAGAMWVLYPYQVMTVGSLTFDGVPEKLSDQAHPISEGDSFLEDRRLEILTPAKGILPRAVQIAESAKVAPGFLEGVQLSELHGTSAVDLAHNSVILRHRGRDAAAEKMRMASLLLAAYEANRPLIAAARATEDDIATDQRKLKQAQADTEAARSRMDQAAAQIKEQRALQALRDRLAQRELAVATASAKVQQLAAQAAKPLEAISFAPLVAESDPQMIDLSSQIQQLDARLALLKSGAAADPASASEALTAAVADLLKQIEAAPVDRQSETPLAAWLGTLQTLARQIRHDATAYLDSQKANRDSLADLRRQQAQKNQVRLGALFAADPQLTDLRQKWLIKDRQANTAADAGLTAQAAALRAGASALMQQMDRRRTELTPPDANADMNKIADGIVAQMRRQQESFTQRLADAARQLSAAFAPQKLSTQDRALADALHEKFAQVQGAAQQLAASFGSEPLDTARLAQALNQQRSALATQAEDRRRAITDDATDRAAAERAQLAADKMRRSALAQAQDELTHAASDRDAAKKEWDALAAHASPNPPVDPAIANQAFLDLQKDTEQYKAELAAAQAKPTITPRDPRDNADSVLTQPLDPAPRIAAAGVVGAFGLLLAGLCWWRSTI